MINFCELLCSYPNGASEETDRNYNCRRRFHILPPFGQEKKYGLCREMYGRKPLELKMQNDARGLLLSGDVYKEGVKTFLGVQRSTPAL